MVVFERISLVMVKFLLLLNKQFKSIQNFCLLSGQLHHSLYEEKVLTNFAFNSRDLFQSLVSSEMDPLTSISLKDYKITKLNIQQDTRRFLKIVRLFLLP